MSKTDQLCFNEYYILEFFNKVREKTKGEFTEEDHQVIDELFTLLEKQDEITEAIGKLAEEKASGELSIFLFDIFDRAQDYPPTEIVDALPEIAEDFVSGLSLMLEEEGTIQSIKKVNEQFKTGITEVDDQKEEIEETVREEMEVEEEAIAVETEEDIPKEETVPDEEIEEEKPPSETSDDDILSFKEYIEKSFFEEFISSLSAKTGKEDAKELLEFTHLLLKSRELVSSQDLPESIINLSSKLNEILPDQADEPPQVARIMDQYSTKIQSCISAITQIDKEIIRKSLELGQIVIPQEEEQFAQEEISDEPTTIDTLLSEYFQAEVNEYIKKFKQIFDKLSKSPDDAENLDELIQNIQSFKEICMIHGYVILEDFSSEMIALLTTAKKGKNIYNRKVDPEVKELLSLLKNPDPYQEAKIETPESIRLHELVDTFQTILFVPLTEKPVEDDTAASFDEIQPEESVVPMKGKSKMAEVYRDLLIDLKPIMHAYFSSAKDNTNQLNRLMKRLSDSAEMIDQKSISDFLNNFSTIISESMRLSPDKIQKAKDDLIPIYDALIEEVKDKFKGEDLINRLSSFRAIYLDRKGKVDFGQKSDLLKALMEVERNRSADLSGDLQKIFQENDSNVRENQIIRFNQLAENMIMIACDKLNVFPNSFISFMRDNPDLTLDNEKTRALSDIFRNVINLIESNGMDAEIEKEIEKINELSEAGQIEDADEDDEIIEEEDLDEIFKIESENYLLTIESALNELESNNKKTDFYENIEKSLHSLKSSARLMGYNDIADVAAPLEEIFEVLHTTREVLEVGDIRIIKDTVNNLKSGIAGSEIDTIKLIDALKKIRISRPEDKSTASSTDMNKVMQEEQLFAGTGDEDDDLLDIFKEEASEYIRIVEEANKKLLTDLYNNEAFGSLEHAMHSLKSAAKMLGFSEIGNLADSVEKTAVGLQKSEISNNKQVNNRVADAIELIKELTEGNKDHIGNIDQILDNLTIHKLKNIDGSAEESDRKKVDTLAELDDQTQMFVKEGWELIEKINRDLVQLEKNPKDKPTIENLNRSIHTLKGSAQILNFKHIGSLSHKIEDIFAKSKGSEEGLDDTSTDIIFKAVDMIAALLSSIKAEGSEKDQNVSEIINTMDRILNGAEPTDSPDKSTVTIISDSSPKLVDTTEPKTVTRDSDQMIKITTDNLDNLVNMAAELVINKTQLSTYLDKLKKIGEEFDADKKRLKNTNRVINNFISKAQVKDESAKDSSGIDHSILTDLESVFKDFNEILGTFDNVSSSFRAISQDFEQNIGQISSLTKSLHDDILQVRMVSTELLFNRYPRAVRDMAKKLKKKVNFVIEGEDTEMDRALIESLTDPVMHLIRNAIDHGIESPEERANQGKSEDGIILLRAKRSKNQVIIEVQDDGRGVDPELIKKEILAKGILDKEAVEKMEESQILNHVFHPGFSTKEQASDVSGRGVGLDVVANSIQKLKGDIRLNSTPGKGTIFSIRVPLTLAITQSMLVQVGSEVLAVPLASVEEMIQFKDPELVEQDEKAFITVRDQLIPVVYLSGLLKYPTAKESKPGKSKTAIIIQEAGARYGLIVENVLRREEIVVKSLGDHIDKIPFVAGGTIYGDGTIGLILDIPSITQKIESDIFGFESDFSAIGRAREAITKDSKKEPEATEIKKKESLEKSSDKPKIMEIKKKIIKGRAPKALIIDDSVSVRKFVSSVLVKNKYSTVLTEDGTEALKELRKTRFDIIITDLEMPNMHGFELIEEIRKYKKYQQIPIVILTGRVGKKHKDQGKKLGANAYITKPFKEKDLLKSLEDFIEIA